MIHPAGPGRRVQNRRSTLVTMTDETLQLPPDDADDLPEQMQVRRQKRAELLERGVEAYPVTVVRTHTVGELVGGYPDLEPGTETGERVSISARAIFLRNTGKLCFARVRAGDGAEIQLMVSLDRVGAESLGQWKHTVDIGDILAVTGEVVASRRGELSIMVESWSLAAKALRPLPVAHKALNEETRIRQRYVDLIVDPDAREMVRLRAAVIRSVRDTLERRGYLEVETPVLQTVHGGATARPFRTHMNAFDIPMTLRIATELYLKRAVVGGVERVYELGRVFRNEGIDSTHAAEYSLLEAYEAYTDYHGMAEVFRDIVLDAARSVGRTVVSSRQGGEIDLEQPWTWTTVHTSLSHVIGEEVTVDTDVTRLEKIAAEHDVVLQTGWDSGQVALELFEKLVEHTLIQPTFVADYPVSVRPLARQHRTEPRLAEAWDLFVDGIEIGVAYSELVDPVVQRERLVEQSLLAAAGDPEAMELDEDFVRALEYGAPPMGGMGMGMDRLLMLLTGAGIRQTILFPTVKPE